uniref:NAD(P)H-quinone oxidoreductase subunit K, chloroplastic n=1 Tax=Lygodium japonicum TaxID=13824 RepID=S4UFS3_LYGJA|nr:NADH-plastoquinone oxidoreductase subunit K [Lygodium japonicum]AGI51397.1 NADH-plastoquinone oxidoreductase subunit K [Lygodium japonicum]AHA59629.1 NADH-plastoquinone oxidoreductase subunit K [Lygodium japonicum]
MVSISKFLSDNRQINIRETQLINSIESFFPEQYPSNSIFLANSNDFSNWSRLSSLWPLLYGTSCCFIEFASLIGSRFDFDRYGLVPRSSPRQADLLITAGTITTKMAPSLVRLYEQMPEPKYVIAMGACTITGGMFSTDSYTTVRGVDKLIPVDIYLPGCPPKPEAIIDAVTKLRKKMAGENNKDRIDRYNRKKYFTLTHKFVVPNLDISSYDYQMDNSSPKFLTDISLETFLEVVKDKSEGSVSGTDI